MHDGNISMNTSKRIKHCLAMKCYMSTAAHARINLKNMNDNWPFLFSRFNSKFCYFILFIFLMMIVIAIVMIDSRMLYGSTIDHHHSCVHWLFNMMLINSVCH
jgi:hypothetical protein